MNWSESEIDAAVEAYAWMLGEERAGRAYNKSDVRRRLLAGSLQRRTEGAAERRMQNITAVLHRCFGVDGIDGYKPLNQTGVGQGAAIRLALLRHLPELGTPPDRANLERRISKCRAALRATGRSEPPIGNNAPAVCSRTSTVHLRDLEVVAWVLEKAAGRCEACDAEAPFRGADGEPYLEVHHVVRLAVGGPDLIENAIGVCPNCHREAHYGSDPDGWITRVRTKIERLQIYGPAR